ncbi:hypothetical protein TWF481_006291 [Arthrobotrys musiformis]|uniref:Uncharacterized protein n=1 Tax=Arthrobotrys musiformis TaxID=47236 RepID=A0AAV9WG81_9PEZI
MIVGWWRLIVLCLLTCQLPNLQTLCAGFAVPAGTVQACQKGSSFECPGPLNSTIGFNRTLTPLQKRNDGDDDDDVVMEDPQDVSTGFDYRVTMAEFDQSCTRGISRLQRYQEIQDQDDIRDSPNPQHEVQLFYTVAPRAELFYCPDFVRNFFDLLGGELLNIAEPTYKQFNYEPNRLIQAGQGEGARALIQVSVPEGHLIVDWMGPDVGWAQRTEAFDSSEEDYAKIMFTSWGVMRSKAMAKDGSKDLNDPKYHLFTITIVQLQNPKTIGILMEVLQRGGFGPGRLSKISAPDPSTDSAKFLLWTALLGTPEIGAVLEMLTSWAVQFKGFKIHSISFGIQVLSSVRDLRATVSVSIGPEQPYTGDLQIPEISYSLQVNIDESPSVLLPYPGETIFESSSPWPVRLDHVKASGDDGGSLQGKDSFQAIGRDSFRSYTYKCRWPASNGVSRVEMVVGFVSGPEQHLVVGRLPNRLVNSENARDIVYQMWDISIGSNSRLSYVTFLGLVEYSIRILRQIFHMKGVELTGGSAKAVSVWPSRKKWEEDIGDFVGQEVEWTEEAVDKRIFQDFLPKCLEYAALRGILAHRGMWSQLGLPSIQAIEIGYHPDAVIEGVRGEAFGILIRLKRPENGDMAGAVASQRELAATWRVDTEGSNEGIFTVSESAAGLNLVPVVGRVGGDLEVTANHGVRDIETLEAMYTRGRKAVVEMISNAAATDRKLKVVYSALARVLRDNAIAFQDPNIAILSSQSPGHTTYQQQAPPESQTLATLYQTHRGHVPRNNGGSGFEPFYQVASDVNALYDRVPFRVGSAGSGDPGLYPYEFLVSPQGRHLIIMRLPQVNEADVILHLSHAIFVTYEFCLKQAQRRSGVKAGPGRKSGSGALAFISLLTLDQGSEDALHTVLEFWGVPTSGEQTLYYDLQHLFYIPGTGVNADSSNPPLGKASKEVAITCVLLGLSEIQGILQFIYIHRRYAGIPGLIRGVFLRIHQERFSIVLRLTSGIGSKNPDWI